jgi:ABC-type transport system involved in multi-copper enzyme maturation permease subunit
MLKEIRLYFASPRFVAVFLICALLILLSIHLGIQEYQAAVAQYETATQLAAQDLHERNSWDGTETRVFRAPDPMQIFVNGVSNDIGRFSTISEWEQVGLHQSPYADDTIFAVFRYLDFSFIVQVVLSLLAFMFTYDAINGERENGTLKLIFAHSLPRSRFILAKLAGSWIGLLIPFIIPVLLGFLLLIAFKIPLTADHWLRIGLLLLLSVLYYSFFIIGGLAVSALTRHSSLSFLILLVCWVFLVLIIPRGAVLTAANLIPVPGAAEINGQIEGFSNEQWKAHEKILSETWRQRNARMSGMDAAARKAYEDEHMWSWMEEDEASRRQVQTTISAFARRLKEDSRNRREKQQRLAFGMSRFSPASAFRLAAMHLAGTGIEMKDRYELAMENYKDILSRFIDEKKAEDNEPGGISITFDSESGFSFKTADLKKTLDISEMPQFEQPQIRLSALLPETLIDFFILAAACLLTFSLSWLAFLRYDLR